MTRTNGHIVLHDLADLGRFLDVVVAPLPAADADLRPPDDGSRPPGPPARSLLPVPIAPVSPNDLATLGAALAGVLADLGAVAEADAQARRQAGAALAVSRRLTDAAIRLEAVISRADEAAHRAEALAEGALSPADRDGAARVAATARTLVATARARLAAAHDQADALAARPDVSRLLDEERRQAAAAERDAEERRRRGQLEEGLGQVQRLLAKDNENEARRLLGVLAKEHPNSPETASLIATLDRRAQAVKTGAAEQALRQARRLARRAPAEAAALLGPLDLDGVPDDLARQVYGCWLAACRRLAPAGVRHYSPRFGQGAVLVPGADGRLEVIAAIGLPDWQPGRRFSPSALRGARPL